jgi:hypothetical protein
LGAGYNAIAEFVPPLAVAGYAPTLLVRGAARTPVTRHVTRLEAEPWSHPALFNVIVQDGTADLWGIVDSEAERKAVRLAAEITPGVRRVNDHLIVGPMVSGV